MACAFLLEVWMRYYSFTTDDIDGWIRLLDRYLDRITGYSYSRTASTISIVL